MSNIFYFYKKLLLKATVITLIFILNSCTSNNVNLNSEGNSFLVVNQLSTEIQKYLFLPTNCEVSMPDSVIIGQDENWVGKLTIICNDKVENIFSFSREMYTKNNWMIKTSYQSENSLLVFEKDKKLITLNITSIGVMLKKTKLIFTKTNL